MKRKNFPGRREIRQQAALERLLKRVADLREGRGMTHSVDTDRLKDRIAYCEAEVAWITGTSDACPDRAVGKQ